MQGAIITSLRNVFKEFRRDKEKKRSPGTKSTYVEKPRFPGANVPLTKPVIPVGQYSYIH